MTLSSMTGYASATGSDAAARWTWELRSVNARGLDLRFRLPVGLDGVEPLARSAAGEAFSRGTITAQVTIERTAQTASVRVDEAALATVVEAARALSGRLPGAVVDVAGLLALKGVLVSDDATGEPQATVEARQRAIVATFREALTALQRDRCAEGARLETVIAEQIATVAALAERIAGHASRTPAAVRERLTQAVARLVEASDTLDPARLAQEAALLATKADIEEEVQRLRSHVAGARDILAAPGPHGRRLDFLTQEFNREANTICSKSQDGEVTAMGLELKAVIDRMREQVQNVE